jgi:hypothetical protein
MFGAYYSGGSSIIIKSIVSDTLSIAINNKSREESKSSYHQGESHIIIPYSIGTWYRMTAHI